MLPEPDAILQTEIAQKQIIFYVETLKNWETGFKFAPPGPPVCSI